MTNEQRLERQISEALSAYLVGGEQIARAAVERALGSGGRVARAAPAKKQRSHRAAYSRRSNEEIARLCDELCAAVSAHTGAMATLAEQLGEPPSRLTTRARWSRRRIARLSSRGCVKGAGKQRGRLAAFAMRSHCIDEKREHISILLARRVGT